jgi:hypothetical protein
MPHTPAVSAFRDASAAVAIRPNQSMSCAIGLPIILHGV